MKKIIVLLLISSSTFASFDMNENMQNSYKDIMDLEFDAAKKHIAFEKKVNPDNGFIILHENYIDFLTILIGEDIQYFEDSEKLKSNRIDLLESNDKNSPYYLYSLAEVHLQWAFSRLKFEQYSTAAYEFIKAYNLLEENQKKFPDFTLNKKGLGLIHALLGAVPEQFHWILDLAGLQGGASLGLSEMDEVLNANTFKMYENEVLFLLSFLQINLNNNSELCQKYLNKIGEGYKENILLNFTAARLSHNLGQNDFCLKVLENRPSSESTFPFYYLDYLQGMSYMYKLDYDNAKQKFEYFINNFKEKNYIKSTYHKLAWITYLRGTEDNYFNSVINEGNASIDEDKVALRDAERNYITHNRLLRARLLYDGGYYEDALLEISSFKVVGKNSMYFDEYWYRSGRIKLELDYDDSEVINNFEKSYNIGKSTANYYAPMSALQIGLIYETQNDFSKAESYFKRCLSMSGFDYERGIHQKAKAGISRISD